MTGGTLSKTQKPPVEISGGTGQPVERDEKLRKLFLMNAANHEYVTGKTHKRPNPANQYIGALVVMIVITVAALVGFADLVRKGETQPIETVLFSLPCLLPVAILAYLTRRELVKYRYFSEHGTLMLGQVVLAEGKWYTTTTGNLIPTGRDFQLKLTYRVRLPNGQTVDDKARGNHAAAGHTPPQPGDPVAVLVSEAGKTYLL